MNGRSRCARSASCAPLLGRAGSGCISPAGGKRSLRLCGATALLLFFYSLFQVFAAEAPLPPPPKQYFTDQAGVVSPAVARQLNQALENFERSASSQVLVAIFKRLPEGAAMEDFTVRVFQHWKAGQQGKDNGAILFLFVQDRKMRIEVGYGLEGAIPDVMAKRIIDDEIRPRLQRGDWNSAMISGVNAILQAARGEYRGTGRTVADRRRHADRPDGIVALIFFAIVFFSILSALRRGRGTLFLPTGRSHWGGGWGGGGFSGGGGGGGGWSGGGGFSGGGGRSGGGGASGSW